VHVDIDVLRLLPLNWISAKLQSALVVTPNDDRPVKLNTQLSEKTLSPHSLNGYVNYVDIMVASGGMNLYCDLRQD
jgi:hypothetical protein